MQNDNLTDDSSDSENSDSDDDDTAAGELLKRGLNRLNQ